MRIVLRADGSSAIGFGHLSRAAALSTAARRAGAEVVLVRAMRDRGADAFVQRFDCESHVIDAKPGSLDDARMTATIAGDDAWLLVDGYCFDSAWFRAVAGGGRNVLYIDDLARERLECEIVVNPNVDGRASRYNLAPTTELLAGPEYSIVDDRFINAREKKALCAGRVEHLLVTYGGSDPPGATLHAIEALALVPARLHVRIVVGAANHRAAEIDTAAEAMTRLGQHHVDVRFGVEDMAEEMSWADCVLAASGVTATEIACVGVPGVVTAVADNQQSIAIELASRAMFDVVVLDAGSAAAMAAALIRLLDEPDRRRGQVDAQRRVIDGVGKDRVIARLLARGNVRTMEEST